MARTAWRPRSAEARARRGLRRRRDGQGRRDRRPALKSITIDPDAVDPEDVEMLQDLVARRGQRGAALGAGARGVQDGRAGRWIRTDAGPRRARRPGRPRRRRRAPAGSRRRAEPRGAGARRGRRCTRRPSSASSPSSASCPASAQRTAQRLAFHILRAGTEEANALADAIREVKEQHPLCEVCFNLADGPRCRICQDERRDAGADLRRRGAGRRDPDRAHARVPRPLPRARRRAVADRRRRPRGPQARRALRARAGRAACARSSSPPTRRRPARPPRCTSPTRCASARPTSRSRGWPAACRWAPTSSTPTRSRSAGVRRPPRGLISCSRAAPWAGAFHRDVRRRPAVRPRRRAVVVPVRRVAGRAGRRAVAPGAPRGPADRLPRGAGAHRRRARRLR